jgi:hypothetical protein
MGNEGSERVNGYSKIVASGGSNLFVLNLFGFLVFACFWNKVLFHVIYILLI